MKILALEFSSGLRSVAVVDGAAGQTTAATEVVESGGRSTRALGMIDTVLQQARLEREQIECIAVGLGPGSYTGIRAAIALAQGWQLARDIRVVGISSSEAVAAQAQADGLMGKVSVIIDAQRNEFYIGTYELTSGRWREIEGLRLADRSAVEAASLTGSLLIGPEVTRWFPQGRLVPARAEMVAVLAATRTDFVKGEQLEPIYLRQTSFVKAPAPRFVS